MRTLLVRTAVWLLALALAPAARGVAGETVLDGPRAFADGWEAACQEALADAEPTFTDVVADWPAACENEQVDCKGQLVEEAAGAFRAVVEPALRRAAHSVLLSTETADDPSRLGRLSTALTDDSRRIATSAADEFASGVRSYLAPLNPPEAPASTVAEKLTELAAVDEDLCSDRLVRLADLYPYARGSEEAALADLQKDTGFSAVVRCRWVRTPRSRDRLDCSPGLRLTALMVSEIQILGPEGDTGFAIASVEARAVERQPALEGEPLPSFGCPEGESSRLTCDAARYAVGLQRQQVAIAVHKNRWVDTSFGCRGLGTLRSRQACGVERLRGSVTDDPALVLAGRSSAIMVHAQSTDGRLASGSVLLGYERWRFETGGFMAASSLADHKLVITATGSEVKVTDIRSTDDLVQETGIFLNFIPTNYEWWGLGLGVATHDSGRWSTYVGPSLRLQTFGNRGIASLVAGWSWRPVRRFPEVTLGDSYPADAAALEGELRTKDDWFVGLQLGFSFGPIGAAEDER